MRRRWGGGDVGSRPGPSVVRPAHDIRPVLRRDGTLAPRRGRAEWWEGPSRSHQECSAAGPGVQRNMAVMRREDSVVVTLASDLQGSAGRHCQARQGKRQARRPRKKLLRHQSFEWLRRAMGSLEASGGRSTTRAGDASPPPLESQFEMAGARAAPQTTIGLVRAIRMH